MTLSFAPGPAIADRHLINRRTLRALDWTAIACDSLLGLQALGAERGLTFLAERFGGPAAWPPLLLALVRIGASPETIREVLEEVWFRGHRPFVDMVRDPAEIGIIFRAAGMPVPIELGDPVTVWRGGAGLSVDQLSAGLSWTTRRDIAARYAIGHAEGDGGGEPLVVRRVVPRSDVLWWTDMEGGAEAVIAAPGLGEVDGDKADWREASARAIADARTFAGDLIRRYAEAAKRGDPPPGPTWLLRQAQGVVAAAATKARVKPLVPMVAEAQGDDVAALQAPSLVTPALVARILAGYRLTRTGIHGPGHWLRVARNGAELARLTPGADAPLVELFALIHDSRRRTEGGDDPEHGPRAGDYVEHLVGTGHLALEPARVHVLAEACRHHEAGKVTRHPTIAACWDADRLELARLSMRPRPDLLSTAAAHDPRVQAAAWERGQAREIQAELAGAWALDPSAFA